MNTSPAFFQSITLTEVVLRVRALEPMLSFYRDLLGFQVVVAERARVELSAEGRRPSLFILELAPNAPVRPAGSSGLFHVAILYPNRESLGRVTRVLSERKVHFATGDHGVSEALYLDDPEGNGIELYADRAVAAWPRPSAPGDLVGMYTEAVDLDALLQAGTNGQSSVLPRDARIGHIHLSVVSVLASEHFYHDVLGFEVTLRSLPGALFLGRDGYHHHLGMNVWRSRRPVVEGALGMARFTVQFRQAKDFERVTRNILPHSLVHPEGVRVTVRDPSGIEIVITGPAK